MSDYLELKFLDHFIGTASTSAPSAVYLGLSTGSFADDNSGTELTGNNYSRKAITFASASSGSISSNASVEFNPATGAWGTVSHWAIFDASSSGNQQSSHLQQLLHLFANLRKLLLHNLV